MDRCSKYCCTKIIDLSVQIGKSVILKNINLHIHCGQLVSIIGPNGAGKSTFFKALLGSIKYTGTLKFEDLNGHAMKPTIGYVPQKLNIDSDSPISVMDFYKIFLGTQDIIQHGLDKDLFHKKLCNLSGGETQRVMLSLALNPVPNILLMDEPTSGIDVSGTNDFWKIISTVRQKYDLAIIIISHDHEYILQYADKVVLINKEVIASGSPKEILTQLRTYTNLSSTEFNTNSN